MGKEGLGQPVQSVRRSLEQRIQRSSDMGQLDTSRWDCERRKQNINRPFFCCWPDVTFCSLIDRVDCHL